MGSDADAGDDQHNNNQPNVQNLALIGLALLGVERRLVVGRADIVIDLARGGVTVGGLLRGGLLFGRLRGVRIVAVGGGRLLSVMFYGSLCLLAFIKPLNGGGIKAFTP